MKLQQLQDEILNKIEFARDNESFLEDDQEFNALEYRNNISDSIETIESSEFYDIKKSEDYLKASDTKRLELEVEIILYSNFGRHLHTLKDFMREYSLTLEQAFSLYYDLCELEQQNKKVEDFLSNLA